MNDVVNIRRRAHIKKGGAVAVIRHVEIKNFRSIKSLSWHPLPGINCLIGPGDSGKSSILDAIDYCVGAKRTLQIDDSDFHLLDHETPIEIRVTIGKLDIALKNIDAYGLYLHGFNSTTGEISSEPGQGLETVLTIQLMVESDLEPQWSLISERAAAQGQSRSLAWADRARIAPTRLGVFSSNHMSWNRGSILNKLSDERVDANPQIAAAARSLRTNFGVTANAQLAQALQSVLETSTLLGVPVGTQINAMIDASSVSIGGGTIALHDGSGIPLKSLGIGSSRLLIAGLQRRVASETSMLLIDELEYGLEPHRIIGLLNALGAKEANLPVQVFMTTHSPVAVRELSIEQLWVLRRGADSHIAHWVHSCGDVQGTIRKYPEAMLAKSILVCEGASEVGLVRGLDLYWSGVSNHSLAASGTASIDGGGDEMFSRALAFQAMGYRTAVLRDSDKNPTPDKEQSFIQNGGAVFCWRAPRALEDELFLSLSDAAVGQLLALAEEIKDTALVDQQIRSASQNSATLDSIRAQGAFGGNYPMPLRETLAKASKNREAKKSWFKSVSIMQLIGETIVGPTIQNTDPEFRNIIVNLYGWLHG